MDGNFYTETYTYKDERILLYKRPHSKNFQCRLRVEGIILPQGSMRKYRLNSHNINNLDFSIIF